MQKVYFISGLGADERSFSFLQFSNYEPVFVNWLTPLSKETLPNYALRLRKTINAQNPIIVGLSFGGMLVTEMAKADNTVQAIIISSNSSKKQFPFWLQIGKYLPLYKWLPNNHFNKTSELIHWFMGTKTKETRSVSQQIISDTDVNFTKWAIEAIMHWNNTTKPKNLVHIHGSNDKLLPYFLVSADYCINGGGHLMIMDEAETVGAILVSIIG